MVEMLGNPKPSLQVFHSFSSKLQTISLFFTSMLSVLLFFVVSGTIKS